MSRKRDEPVRLTRIYTRAGDAGETSLGDGSRVTKTDPRIEAYGTVDELNAALGAVLAAGPPDEYRPWLERIQNDLFDLGADLAVPGGGSRERLRVAEEQVFWLEGVCDLVNERLEPLRSFVLPGAARSPRGCTSRAPSAVAPSAAPSRWPVPPTSRRRRSPT